MFLSTSASIAHVFGLAALRASLPAVSDEIPVWAIALAAVLVVAALVLALVAASRSRRSNASEIGDAMAAAKQEAAERISADADADDGR